MIGGNVWGAKGSATYVIPFAVNLIPKIAQSVNALCHTVKVRDVGSG